MWVEALVIVWLSWLYDEISNLSSLRLHTALMHAGSVLHVEQVWHLEPERALNVWAAAHPALALPLADFYDTSHFAVTLGLLGWLWWRHPDLYRSLRRRLVLINMIGCWCFGSTRWRRPGC